jgi:hypothetical protein
MQLFASTSLTLSTSSSREEPIQSCTGSRTNHSWELSNTLSCSSWTWSWSAFQPSSLLLLASYSKEDNTWLLIKWSAKGRLNLRKIIDNG